MTSELLSENNKMGDNVLSRARTLEAQGDLQFPVNYPPENAMKSAMLQLQELKGSKKDDYKPTLEFVTPTSIASALMDMTVQGLSPAKNQGYFIMYDDKIRFQESYHGTMAVAKRVAGAKEINAEVISGGDKVKCEARNGKIVELEYTQSFGNRNTQDITGAYVTAVFEDESRNYVEIMTFEETEEAWRQSQMVYSGVLKEDGTHRRFPQEMAKKTVISHVCKKILNSTGDASLLSNQTKESGQRQRKEILDTEVEEDAGREQSGFEPPVFGEAQCIELENEKPIDVSDSEEIKEPATEKENEEEPF